MPSYNDPKHPEHKEWLLSRRKRFIQILREGKRVCKLTPEERHCVIALCGLMEVYNKELEKEENLS